MRAKTRIKISGRRTKILPSVGEAELSDALDRCNGNVRITALYLGVHRSTVYRLMDRYDIVAFLDVKS